MQTVAKRKYPRFDKDCEVRYKVLELAEMPQEATTVNISGGGVCFLCDEEVPVETVLALDITLPGAKKQILAMGKVVWTKNSSQGGYEHGVEFWWLGYQDDDATSRPFGSPRST